MSGSYRKCLLCKRTVRVNLRGRLRTHVTAPPPALLTICPGSQQPPTDVLAVLLAKPPSRMETVNDLDQDLITFWRVLP